MRLKLGILRLRTDRNSCLEQADDEAGRVKGEEDQDQRHHGAGQLELLCPPAIGSVELLGLGDLGVDLHKGPRLRPRNVTSIYIFCLRLSQWRDPLKKITKFQKLTQIFKKIKKIPKYKKKFKTWWVVLDEGDGWLGVAGGGW